MAVPNCGQLFVIAGLAMLGCGGVSDREQVLELRERMSPTYDEETGRLTQLALDADGDGVVETVAHMDGVRLLSVETDRDSDGRIDRREHFRTLPAGDPVPTASQEGQPPNVTLERVERQPATDGRMTRFEYFENGVLSVIEEDTDLDGRIDTWQRYVDGVLLSIEFDTNGSGAADRRLTYLPTGDVRIDVDAGETGEFVPLRPGQ